MFLSINGHTVEVRDLGARRRVRGPGPRSRSARGALRDARRYLRASMTFETTWLPVDDAIALRRLINGEGHHFPLRSSFDAATGLQPCDVLASGVAIDPSQTTIVGGELGAIVTTSGASGPLFVWDAQLLDEWTFIVARKDGSTWRLYAATDDGRRAVDGALGGTFGQRSATGGIGLYPRVIEGFVALWKDSAGVYTFNNITVLPWRASDEMLRSFTAASTARRGPLPVLIVGGDAFSRDGTEVFALGTVDSAPIEAARSPARWDAAGGTVTFTLDVLDPTFVATVP